MEELLNNVEEKILESLDGMDVEAEIFGDVTDDAVAIGKLGIEHRKIDLEEEESEAKRTNDAVKLEIEKQKADNDSEKNRIDNDRLALEKERLKFDRVKAERDAEIENAKLRNEVVLKGMEICGKFAIVGCLMVICAAGAPLKEGGIIPDRLPFYNQAIKLVSKYV